MKITDIRVFPVLAGKLKAHITITLDNCFVIRDLKIIQGNTGLCISMPAKLKDGTYRDIAHPLDAVTGLFISMPVKLKDGTYRDIAHPLNAVARDRLEKAILVLLRRWHANATAVARVRPS